MNEFELLALAAKAAKEKAPERTLGHKIKDNLIGIDDGVESFGEQVGTFVGEAIEAGTGGLVGDEANARGDAILGADYNEALAARRQREAQFEEQTPGRAIAAEVVGPVAAALLTRGRGGAPGRVSQIAKQIMGKGGRAGKLAGSMAAGAGYGGTYGAMEGEGENGRAEGAKTGALIGAGAGLAAPFLGGMVKRFADGRAANRAIKEATADAPSAAEQFAKGRAGYKAVDEAGVQVTPGSFDRMRESLLSELESSGLDNLPGDSLTPGANRVMSIADNMSSEMAKDPTSALPFESLDKLRRHAGTAASSQNKTDAALGARAIRALDEFIEGLQPGDVVAGDANALKTILPKVREIWSGASRTQLIEDAQEASGNYLSGPASGIKNQFRRILSNKNLSRGFDEAEKAAMRRVMNGSMPEQLLGLLGSGVGQLMQVGVGSAGGLPGMALGALTAAGTRKASEAVTRKNAEIVRALVANGGMKNIPQANPEWRRIAEVLARRIGAGVPQQ